MLEQQQSHEEEPKQYAPASHKNQNAALALTPHAQALVAAYMAHIEAEQQSGTRLRLEELIAAYRELDSESEQATRSAIQQLEIERIAAEQQQAVTRQQASVQRKHTRPAKQSVRPATLTALKVFGAGSLGMFAILLPLTGTHVFGALPTWLMGTLAFMYLVLPALLGAGVGLRARHRRMLGTVLAMGMLIPLMSLVCALACSLQSYPLPWTQNFRDMATVLTLLWLPIGVASTGLTGWGRDVLCRSQGKMQMQKL